MVHNHPSGDPEPSSADVEMTRQIVSAARALNLVVHDHLVVGREGVASLKALGLIHWPGAFGERWGIDPHTVPHHPAIIDLADELVELAAA